MWGNHSPRHMRNKPTLLCGGIKSSSTHRGINPPYHVQKSNSPRHRKHTHFNMWEKSNPPRHAVESNPPHHMRESNHLIMCRNQTHLHTWGKQNHLTMCRNRTHLTMCRNQTHLTMWGNQTHLTMRRWKGFCKDLTSMGLYARRDTAITWRLIYIWAQWVQSLDYLTTHTSLSPIQRGFAPCFVNYKKGCTQLAATSDKVY